MFFTHLGIAARNLAQHKKRTLFLGLALASVTGLLVVLGALTQGIQDTMLRSASTLMTGHVNIGGFYKVTAGMAAPLVTDAQKVLDTARPQIPELDYAVMRGRGYAKAVSESASMDLVLGGIDVGAERDFRGVVQIASGSLDELARPGTILLFEEQAKRLKVTAGDALTLVAPTTRGMNNTADVRVGAVARNLGVLSSFCAFMPTGTLNELYQMNSTATGAIQLYLKDPADSAKVSARLREVFAKAGWRVMDPDPQAYFIKLMMSVTREDWTGQKLDMTTWEDEISFLSWVIGAINGLTLLLVFILMVIIVAGIASTMWIAIRERTRELGTLRAIGMHRRAVLRMILLEALLLGLLGTGAGVLGGGLFCGLLNSAAIKVPEAAQMLLMSDTLTLALRAGPIAGAAGVITLVATLAALFPALHAARLEPVTAMHHIG